MGISAHILAGADRKYHAEQAEEAMQSSAPQPDKRIIVKAAFANIGSEGAKEQDNDRALAEHAKYICDKDFPTVLRDLIFGYAQELEGREIKSHKGWHFGMTTYQDENARKLIYEPGSGMVFIAPVLQPEHLEKAINFADHAGIQLIQSAVYGDKGSEKAVFATIDGNFTIWDIKEDKKLYSAHLTQNPGVFITSLSIYQDDNKDWVLAYGSSEGSAGLWNLDIQTKICHYSARRGLNIIKASAVGNFDGCCNAYFGCDNGSLAIVTPTSVKRKTLFEHGISSLCYAEDQLFVALSNGEIHVVPILQEKFNLSKQHEKAIIKMQGIEFKGLSCLLSVSSDSLCVWDLETYECIYKMALKGEIFLADVFKEKEYIYVCTSASGKTFHDPCLRVCRLGYRAGTFERAYMQEKTKKNNQNGCCTIL